MDNAAVRTMLASVAAAADGNIDALERMTRADFLYDDRRRGLKHDFESRDLLGSSWELLRGAKFDVEPLRTRGDRLALLRVTVEFAENNWVAASLLIIEVDECGVGIANILFDEDDMEAALAELDKRHTPATGTS